LQEGEFWLESKKTAKHPVSEVDESREPLNRCTNAYCRSDVWTAEQSVAGRSLAALHGTLKDVFEIIHDLIGETPE
jgi:hypothetical protein